MALQKIQPGSLQSLNDPLCAVKDNETLVNADYSGMEKYNTEIGKWFESRREHELLNHCESKDHDRGQQDDGVTSAQWPVKDDMLKPRTGGPTWTDKKHH